MFKLCYICCLTYTKVKDLLFKCRQSNTICKNGPQSTLSSSHPFCDMVIARMQSSGYLYSYLLSIHILFTIFTRLLIYYPFSFCLLFLPISLFIINSHSVNYFYIYPYFLSILILLIIFTYILIYYPFSFC